MTSEMTYVTTDEKDWNCWEYGDTEPAESCTDEILNQDETDVDCGGVCNLCEGEHAGHSVSTSNNKAKTTLQDILKSKMYSRRRAGVHNLQLEQGNKRDIIKNVEQKIIERAQAQQAQEKWEDKQRWIHSRRTRSVSNTHPVDPKMVAKSPANKGALKASFSLLNSIHGTGANSIHAPVRRLHRARENTL